MKKLTIFAIVVFLLVGISSGCTTKKLKPPSKRDLVYGYLPIIEEEAAGKAAFPAGNTWENYWKERFRYLRARTSDKASYEDVISFVIEMRKKCGLPPLE